MPIVQLFALVIGAVYVVVGILGFIPPLLFGEIEVAIGGPFTGYLLGLFAVNWFHNLAHLLIGIAGLAVYRSFEGSRIYALVLGIAYLALFVLGLIFGLNFLGGLLPLNIWDHILHLITGLIALAIYFRPGTQVPAPGS